jgi:hypothetical protein
MTMEGRRIAHCAPCPFMGTYKSPISSEIALTRRELNALLAARLESPEREVSRKY